MNTQQSFAASLDYTGEIDSSIPDYWIVPSLGSTETAIDYYKSGGPHHVVQHSFYWPSSVTDNGYENAYDYEYNGMGPSGMEIDIIFNGHDKTYEYYGRDRVNKGNVFGVAPYSESQSSEGNWWGSDMPYSYIDTSFSDNVDEPTAGIGSGGWRDAAGSTWYTAWTFLDVSDSADHKIVENDDYKVQVSRTHKEPEGHYSGKFCTGNIDDPWCRWADAHPKGPTLPIPTWTGKAPGIIDWMEPSEEDLFYDKDTDFVPPTRNYGEWDGVNYY